MTDKEYLSNQKKYKSCTLPSCKNTTVKTPHKVFIQAPRNEKKRKAWSIALGFTDNKLITSSNFVCEDHFAVSTEKILKLNGYIHHSKKVYLIIYKIFNHYFLKILFSNIIRDIISRIF